MTFESILQHLGPSAKPLMDFMNNNMARNLSQTNKYVRAYVIRHKDRWGFVLAPYSENPDRSYVIKLDNKVYRGVLRHAEFLTFKPNGYPNMWAVNSSYLGQLICGTKKEIYEVMKEASPFLVKRAMVTHKAHYDTYTIKAGPPPAINPWLKKRTT
jgi:hypothetical protein